jgi:biopolymer transport protein TolR
MAFEERGSNDAISQINVTPLVDVMLVLLVIFMVTAPILQQGVSVNLPKVQAAPLVGEDDQLVVAVTRAGTVLLNDATFTLADLDVKLRAILREQPQRQVFLRADEAVSYGQVVKVLAVIKESGVQRLGMVTEPPSTVR